ncbi:hypothetical protein [Desulfonema magnum]|uniref:Uncharacterized protein n=1 Tax=Desulfonema magnum TaxID=45655 RepID=A0A975BR09_9BACT|nr:hypothetical protein [Desulfonema magnum]QTA89485.1 Uncharacterized protein dnm_055410 [Desulfonema magnum]
MVANFGTLNFITPKKDFNQVLILNSHEKETRFFEKPGFLGGVFLLILADFVNFVISCSRAEAQNHRETVKKENGLFRSCLS